jgi:hypothetical protein
MHEASANYHTSQLRAAILSVWPPGLVGIKRLTTRKRKQEYLAEKAA